MKNDSKIIKSILKAIESDGASQSEVFSRVLDDIGIKQSGVNRILVKFDAPLTGLWFSVVDYSVTKSKTYRATPPCSIDSHQTGGGWWYCPKCGQEIGD